MIFAWHSANVEHIAKHGVRPEEAEYVIRHARPPYPRMQVWPKRLVWGQTASGRYLQVIFVVLPDERVNMEWLDQEDQIAFMEGARVAYVVHAMEMTEDQKRRHRKR